MKLKKHELLDLFNASIENSIALFEAANELVVNYPKKKFPSLGLAELALEELGKSFMCLAYYSRADINTDWKDFWRKWRSHDMKAHTAFHYEFFCLLRVDINDELYHKLPSPMGKFSTEKEHSFYVDIDKSSRKIHRPGKEINDKECFFRVFTLIGLLNAAIQVRLWMDSANPNSYKKAISDYAFKTLSTKMYQQDVKYVLETMTTSDVDYNSALADIWELFNPDNYNE